MKQKFKRNLCLFTAVALTVTALSACGAKTDSTTDEPETTAEETVGAITDDISAADNEIDISDVVLISDESKYPSIVDIYNAAAENAKDLKQFIGSTYAVINQTSEDTDFNINTSQTVDITLNATEEGKEEFSAYMTGSSGGDVEESKFYFKDNTVYTEQGGYKIKTADQAYSAVNPRELEVVNTISFNADAVTSISEKHGKTDVYVFELKPDKVTFAETAGVDITQLKTVAVAAEIEDNTLLKSQFSYVVETDTATIIQSNKEAMEAQGVEVPETENKESKPVTFEYTVKTGYTAINEAEVELPDFSDYKTRDEIAAQEASETETGE